MRNGASFLAAFKVGSAMKCGTMVGPDKAKLNDCQVFEDYSSYLSVYIRNVYAVLQNFRGLEIILILGELLFFRKPHTGRRMFRVYDLAFKV